MSAAERAAAGRLENVKIRGNGEVANPHGNAIIADPAPFATGNARTNLPDLYLGMNKTERQRAQELEAMKKRGDIAEWWYEALTLKLAHDCRYTPDFLVQENDGSMRLEEIKGFWRDDARVKSRVCVRTFPFPLTVLQLKKGGGWKVETVKP